MLPTRPLPLPALGGLLLALGGCVPLAGGGSAPPPADFTALADTLVCVVDRTAPTGLRELQAKKTAAGGVVLYDAGQVRALEEVHPVALLAGYAANEPWVARGEPVALAAARYLPYQGERRVPIDQISRVGVHQAIPLFAARGEQAPHTTLYVPTRPGCIFQPYVRADLVQP